MSVVKKDSISDSPLQSTLDEPSDAPVVISGLVKTFGRTRALDGLNLTVSAGEVHGLLGPNVQWSR